MLKSPLRYPGGKSRAAEIIVNQFPNFDEYREPFLGGGSVFIQTKQLFPDKKFWINDAYFDLFKFWQQVQIDVAAIVEKVSELKSKFANGKKLYQVLKLNRNNSKDLETASAFFILNRITFSGTTLSGGCYEKFALNLKTCRHRWLITLDDCEYIRELFKFAKIAPLQFAYGMRNVKENSSQIERELIISNYS